MKSSSWTCGPWALGLQASSPESPMKPWWQVPHRVFLLQLAVCRNSDQGGFEWALALQPHPLPSPARQQRCGSRQGPWALVSDSRWQGQAAASHGRPSAGQRWGATPEENVSSGEVVSLLAPPEMISPSPPSSSSSFSLCI